MKIGRWLTWAGGILLFLTGIGHGLKLKQVDAMIQAAGVKPPLDAITRGCWLAFSGQMIALAVLAIVGSGMNNGARIVLICAAAMIFNAALLFHFLGLFVGVWISGIVGLLFLAGGLMLGKQQVA